jgi:RNA polymerase I-specific transcription initiation factor RRN3
VAEDLDLFLDPFEIPTESKEEEAKQFVEQLWSTNCQGKPNYRVEKPTTVKRNRSSIISTAATQEKKRLDGGVGGLGKGSNPLDSYFPFDPYLLQESYPFVHPYYRNWEDCILSIEDIVKDTAAEGSEEADTNVCIHDGTKDELIFQDVDVDEDDDNTAFTNKSVDDEIEEDHDSQDDLTTDDNMPTEFKPKSSTSLHEGSGFGFELEIRRSRAMSTGSHCSW